MYIDFSANTGAESKEVSPGVVLDYPIPIPHIQQPVSSIQHLKIIRI